MGSNVLRPLQEVRGLLVVGIGGIAVIQVVSKDGVSGIHPPKLLVNCGGKNERKKKPYRGIASATYRGRKGIHSLCRGIHNQHSIREMLPILSNDCSNDAARAIGCCGSGIVKRGESYQVQLLGVIVDQ